MKDDMWTTNNNWMDENLRIKNDQKLQPNDQGFQSDADFLRPDEYSHRDNMQGMIPHGLGFFAPYDYHAQPLFYENLNMFNPIEKEAMPPFQEVMFDRSEALPFCTPDLEQIIKVSYPMEFGYWQGMVPNPAENIQALLMNHDRHFDHRTSSVFPIKQKIIKQEEPFFSMKGDEDYPSHYKTKKLPPHFFDVQPSKSATPPDKKDEVRLIGGITREERNVKIRLYLQKRKRRTYTKKVSYDCRKKVADQRIRIKGRFVTKAQALSILHLDEHEQYSADQLKRMLERRQKDDRREEDSQEVKIQ